MLTKAKYTNTVPHRPPSPRGVGVSGKGETSTFRGLSLFKHSEQGPPSSKEFQIHYIPTLGSLPLAFRERDSGTRPRIMESLQLLWRVSGSILYTVLKDSSVEKLLDEWNSVAYLDNVARNNGDHVIYKYIFAKYPYIPIYNFPIFFNLKKYIQIYT